MKDSNNSHSSAPLYKGQNNIQGFIPSDFWRSMAYKRNATSQNMMEDPDLKIAKENFKRLCDHCLAKSPPDYSKAPTAYSIPPIIHFIWLGSPLPSKVKEVIGTWKTSHPEWQIMIWTDLALPGFSWSTERLQSAFYAAASWAERADLLRFEILYQFGGIYSDTDVVCLKSFYDLITNGFTFFAGQEVNYMFEGLERPLYVGSAVIGAVKGSSIVKYCLENYKTYQEAPTVNQAIRCGPGMISRACHAAFETVEKDTVLILPCSYFYPLPIEWRGVSGKDILNFVSSESLAIHLWEASWF